MKMIRSVCVALIAAGSTASAVPAATFFDPATKTYVTYDRDALGGSTAPATRQARRPAPPPAAVPAPAPIQQAAMPQVPPPMMAPPNYGSHPQPGPEFDRQVVAYDMPEEEGTIVIDTQQKFLYYVLGGGEAIRFGVGVGKEGFGWSGTVQVGSMQEWPKWFPPADMVKRRPELAEYQKTGMQGGEMNPLGARALYLHDDAGKDTLFRIHGTNEPWSIGLNVSSGCIRMLNENVMELYTLAKVGAKVIVI